MTELQLLERDAARWRSLLACERIRFIGGSKLNTPAETLAGFDFHRKHPDRDDAGSRQILIDFVDGRIPAPMGGEK